ncbi:MAG: DNA polymerase III subunit gamma/tau [Candidatus Magasanikbacteria bacterium]|nr:DNA polymerase III subunit gamma/tau [Candidatus Magasanikbacteria bacterium]
MALYHTHRPQLFSTVVGQEHIVKTLLNQIRTNKVAHAYLFSGPRGIGKTTTARLVAKAVNCLNRKDTDTEPCNTCASCISITAGNALDVIEIDAASHTGVDNVREHIIDNAQFRPTSSRYKVFIIDEVHMLSNSAFNALLKTLEEPPKHVLFILATTEMDHLPDTIISRCQRFTFSKIAHERLHDHLAAIAHTEGRTCDAAVLDHIVHKSEGSVRDAVSLLEQVLATTDTHITEESVAHILPPSTKESTRRIVHSLITKQTHTALEEIALLHQQGSLGTAMFDDIISLLRTILLSSLQAGDAQSLSTEEKIDIQVLADQTTPTALIACIESAFHYREHVSQTPLPQLPLELFIIAVTQQSEPQIASSTPIKATPLPATPPAPKVTVGVDSVEKQNQAILPKDPAPVTAMASLPPTIPTVPQETPEASTTHDTADALPHEIIPEETVRYRWPECIRALEKDAPSLTFILKTAHIVSAEKNTLLLAVDNTFQKDKILEKNCKKKIEDVLHTVFQQTIVIQAQIKATDDTKKDQQAVQELANTFGGHVVGA